MAGIRHSSNVYMQQYRHELWSYVLNHFVVQRLWLGHVQCYSVILMLLFPKEGPKITSLFYVKQVKVPQNY